MSLSNQQKKHYRTIGHSLNPIVTIAANGLSDNVLAELARALNDHELIKVKLSINDKATRTTLAQSICDHCQCELVQEIGKVALLLKESKKPNPKLSNLRR